MNWLAGAVLSAVAVLGVSGQAQEKRYPFNDTSLSMEARIDNLLSLMTIEEKTECLSTRTGVARLGVGNMGNSEGIHGLVQRGYPGGGTRPARPSIPTTQFPQPPGMGETWDPALVREAGAVEGREARFISDRPGSPRPMLILWGPQADLERDPRWGRSEEVYGEDPFLNGTMVVSFIKGIQGDDPNHWQAAALLKHFLANSNENFRTSSSSDFDQRLFYEYYSVPFRMGFLEGGAKAVMASYNAWNGTAMILNPALKNVLEDKWGVEILSGDGGAVKLLVSPRKLFTTQEDAVVASVKAGINQFLEPVPEALTAVKDGKLTVAEIDGVLRRKFRVAVRLGMLDGPKPASTAAKEGPEPWDTDADKDVSKKMALESVVLLKNENHLLPLKKGAVKTIAVIGPLADTVHWDWYGGIPRHAVTPLEGIRQEAGPDVKVTYAKDETERAAVLAATGADVAIVVVGNDPTCGPDMGKDWHNSSDGGSTLPCTEASDGREGRDRESLTLAQEQLVKQVHAVNPHTVVMLVSSFPFAINWSQAHVPAILHMAHSSQDEGTALAKVLFGEYNPGGHTVVTWPKSVEQLPEMMDYNIRHGRTYQYFKGEPLYPFGFGLSYTTFRYANLKTNEPQMAKDGSVKVSVDVTNTGASSGDEVVQMYVQHMGSKVERPVKELKGFERVAVGPGETKTVTMTLRAADLAYWDEKPQRFRVEEEPVSVMVGGSSSDLPLKATVRVK